MAKVSRPVVYIAVAAAVVFAVVVLTEPDKPAHKTTTHSKIASGPSAPPGFTPEDMTAHFERYKVISRDAFHPAIVPNRAKQTTGLVKTPGGLAGMLPPLAGRGSWALTGVSETNGIRSALVENSTSNDSEFLKVGQIWNGLTVAAIEDTAVVFVNALGQQTRLTFAEPPEPGATPGAPSANPTAPGTARPGAAPIATIVPRTGASTAPLPAGVSVPPGGVPPVVPTFPNRGNNRRNASPTAAATPTPGRASGPRLASRSESRPAGQAE